MTNKRVNANYLLITLRSLYTDIKLYINKYGDEDTYISTLAEKCILLQEVIIMNQETLCIEDIMYIELFISQTKDDLK
jgi:hypothetical protein